MLRFLRTTFLWIALLPVACGFTGAALNQAVLAANHDTFPVLVNSVKLKRMTGATDTLLEIIFGTPKAQAGAPQIPQDDRGHLMLDDTHCVMTSATHLNFLADWIDLKDAIYSPGDMLLDFGSWSFPFAVVAWGACVSIRLHDSREGR
jgi:hypothetical protein